MSKSKNVEFLVKANEKIIYPKIPLEEFNKIALRIPDYTKILPTLGIEKIAESIISNRFILNSAFESLSNPLNSLQSTLTESLRFLQENEALASLTKIPSPLAGISQTVNSALSFFPQFSDQFELLQKNLMNIKANYPQFADNSIGVQLVESINSLDIDDSVQNVSKILNEIKETIFEHCKKTHIDKSSFNNILTIVLFIFSLLHAYFSSASTEEKILSQIDNSRIEILEKLDEFKPKSNHNLESIYYCSLRPTYLFAEPKISQHRISILFPNTILKLIRKKKKWIYVEYYDFISGVPRYGWVMKKYCKLIR